MSKLTIVAYAAFALSLFAVGTVATARAQSLQIPSWLLIVNYKANPAEVAVVDKTPPPPWTVHSRWYSDPVGAWNRACMLVKYGDGRRSFTAPHISAGRVVCDAKCKCTL